MFWFYLASSNADLSGKLKHIWRETDPAALLPRPMSELEPEREPTFLKPRPPSTPLPQIGAAR